TALHCVAVRHATLRSSLFSYSARSLVVCSLMLLPFQRWANVPRVSSSSSGVSQLPTAVQALGPTHDTSSSRVVAAPLGGSIVRCVQLVPFQVIASAIAAPDLSVYWPTAMQPVAEPHETPWSSLSSAPAGTAAVWSDHSLPFQRCTIAAPVPLV